MLKINIIGIGKIKEQYIKDGIREFEKRLTRYVHFQIFELSEENDHQGVSLAIKKETSVILSFLEKKRGTYNVLLDIKGEFLSSEKMAEKINHLSQKYSEINFIIGGSNGVSDELRQKVDFALSFSRMTFPHQLMRLILLEQIYRWISINHNIKYHK